MIQFWLKSDKNKSHFENSLNIYWSARSHILRLVQFCLKSYGFGDN
jgi:hypothetical protein